MKGRVRRGRIFAGLALVVASLAIAAPAGSVDRVHTRAAAVTPVVTLIPISQGLRAFVGAHTLTVTIAGPTGSGRVVSTPGTIDCPDVACSSSYATVAGTSSISLSATPADGFQFERWDGGCGGIAPICTLSVGSDVGVTATFVAAVPPSGTNFLVVVPPAGAPPGLITSTPAGISCPGVCNEPFVLGTAVTLVSPPSMLPITQALQWNSDCQEPAVEAHSCTVVVAGPTQVVAPTIVPRPVLRLSVSGPGSVGISPTGLDRSLGDWAGDRCGSFFQGRTTCTIDYHLGDKVTLRARVALGGTFAGWGVPECGMKLKCVVTIGGYSEITANFTPVLFTVFPLGSGTITIGSDGTPCSTDCSVKVPLGSTLTLTATPLEGHQFASWVGCDPVPATPNVCTVVVSTASQSASPIFDDGPQLQFLVASGFNLTVFKQGNGVVNATPPGSDVCNPGCANNAKITNLSQGQMVVLTAVDSGSWKFDHWGTTCPKAKKRACPIYGGQQNAVGAIFKRR